MVTSSSCSFSEYNGNYVFSSRFSAVENPDLCRMSSADRLLAMFNNSTTPADLYQSSAPVLFPFYTRLLMTAFGAFILLVGICGNILVPTVVWTNKCMRSSTNLFLVNLSVADLLVLVLCIPTVLIEVHTKPETWMLGKIMCWCYFFLNL